MKKAWNMDIGEILENIARKSPDANVEDIKERIMSIVSSIETLFDARRDKIDKAKNVETFRDECTAQIITLTVLQRAYVEADPSGNARRVAELAALGRFFWTELH